MLNSLARVVKSSASATNGTITILVGLKLVLVSFMRAGSIKSMLLPPPVGSTVINKSLRTPLDCIVIMCVIYARCSFDFHFVL
jgi:hypothetical protein